MSTAHALQTGDPLLSSAALDDYRRDTAGLREAIEARLDAALPPGTKEFALWGIDAVTPVVIDAARRLQLQVVAIYMRDDRMAGDSLAGVPILNGDHLPKPSMVTIVLTGSEGGDLPTIRAKVRPERIVELAAGAPAPQAAAPEPVMITHLAEARRLRESGQLEQALAAYRGAALAADSADLLRTAATVAEDAGCLPQALRLYRRLLRRWPADATVIRYRIALLYQQMGDAPRARSWFARVFAAPDADAALKSECYERMQKQTSR
jgi:tetratricopeptide (TPR) repeat protein